MIQEQEHLERIDRLRRQRETAPEEPESMEPPHPWIRYEVRPRAVFAAVCLCGREVVSEVAELRCRCGRSSPVQWTQGGIQ